MQSTPRKSIQSLSFLLLAGLFCVSSQAAEDQPATSERNVGPWVWSLSGGIVHQFDTDLSDADGEFSVSRGFIQGSLGYAWNRRTSVSVSLGAGNTNYDFSRAATIDGEAPWEQIEDYRISVPIRFSPSERSDVLIIPSVRTNAESGADHSDGRTEGVLAGFGWKFSESLTLGPGFGWFSEISGGSRVFPILVIDWKITEKWALSTGQGTAASQGPGLTLNYQLAEKWRLGVSGRYEKTQFVLEDTDARAGGVGEEKSLPLVFVATYSPGPMTSFSAIVGAEFEGKLRLEDSRGNRIASTDFDTAPVIGLAFSSRF